jgi:cellobiose phosphorylase
MFKLEPYILPADIYSSKGLEGVGGWNWYTGAASWYYRAIVEYILGLKIKNNFIEFAPCISKNWKEYEIKYKYKTSVYYIKVKNPKRQKYRSRESNCRWLRDKKQKDSFRRQW